MDTLLRPIHRSPRKSIWHPWFPFSAFHRTNCLFGEVEALYSSMRKVLFFFGGRLSKYVPDNYVGKFKFPYLVRDSPDFKTRLPADGEDIEKQDLISS